MNHSNLTVSELIRVATDSDNSLVIALSAKLQELIEEIEVLNGHADGELEVNPFFDCQFEYVKRLCQLPNNY